MQRLEGPEGRDVAARVNARGRPAEALPRNPVAIRPPTLRVVMDVGFPDDPGRALASVHVHVSGGRAPVRLHFHVDGALVAVQCGTGMVYDLPVGRVSPGSHTITVRASDALGRWADTSLRVDLPLSEATLATREPAWTPPAGRGTPWHVRGLVSRIWR